MTMWETLKTMTYATAPVEGSSVLAYIIPSCGSVLGGIRTRRLVGPLTLTHRTNVRPCAVDDLDALQHEMVQAAANTDIDSLKLQLAGYHWLIVSITDDDSVQYRQVLNNLRNVTSLLNNQLSRIQNGQ